MAVEDAIYSRGITHVGLSALISTRLYPGIAPQDVTLPAVVYQRVSSVPESLLTADTNVTRDRFQFTVLASSYESLVNVGVQVKAAFQRWQGTEASVIIEDSYLTGDVDLYQDDTEIFGKAIDFEIVNRG